MTKAVLSYVPRSHLMEKKKKQKLGLLPHTSDHRQANLGDSVIMEKDDQLRTIIGAEDKIVGMTSLPVYPGMEDMATTPYPLSR